MVGRFNRDRAFYPIPVEFYLSTTQKVVVLLCWFYVFTFRDLTELACNIAIGLSAIDWVGVPLALIWYQLPEVLSSVECSTTAEPFARFLATQLHFVRILQSHQTVISLPLTSSASQMFHQGKV